MKKHFSIIFSTILSLTILLSSCIFIGPSIKGNGDVDQQTRTIDNFTKIKSSHGLEVILVPDDTEFVIVEADNNLFDAIKTEVNGSELRIFSDQQIRKARAKKVIVHYIKINDIRSSSGSHVKTAEVLKTKRLSTKASSGSHQNIEVNTSSINARCSSGSHMKLRGKSQTANFKASSGAHIKGSDFETDEGTADVSSGAHITFRILNSLDAEASSGGHIYYLGNPSITNVNKSSGGQIIKQ